MSELAISALVLGLAIAVALLARVLAARRGPAVDIGRLVDHAAVVVFTADHCTRCDQALDLAQSQSLPVVQVRAETDGAVMEALGVEAVPLTVVAAGGGRLVAQFGGVPSSRRLARAVGRAANTAT